MKASELCPICGEGHSTVQLAQVEQEYKGQLCEVAMHLRVCDHCTSEFVGAAESKLNKRAMMAFRKRVDNLLPGNQITELRAQLGITQAQAARLFGGGPVAFSKYENDDVAQSEAMDNLLRVIRRSSEAFWVLVDEKGMRDELSARKLVAF